MGKRKKNKVPKITEEQYAKYVASLKEEKSLYPSKGQEQGDGVTEKVGCAVCVAIFFGKTLDRTRKLWYNKNGITARTGRCEDVGDFKR